MAIKSHFDSSILLIMEHLIVGAVEINLIYRVDLF